MSIVIEGVTKSVDLGFDFVLDLALAVDGPQLAELASQFEVYTASDEGIATGLMHRANAINVEVLSHGFETAREVQLPLDLLAVVIVHEVSVQRLQEVILKIGKMSSLQEAKQITKVNSTMESDPVVLWVEDEP